MRNIVKARIGAFIFDFCLVAVISGLVLSFLPRSELYNKSLKEQSQALNDVFNDEMNDEKFIDNYSIARFNVEKEGMHLTLLTCLFSLAYFGTFAYYKDGKTIGKKLLNIKINYLGNDGRDHFCFLLRAFLLDGVLNSLAMIGALFVLKPEDFFTASLVISAINVILFAISVGMMKKRKDGRTLYDLICNTEVIPG